MLAAGTRIGAYEVVALLGTGGMGDVYRARDHRLSRDVAIKIVRPDHADSDRATRIEREARVLASLNHPNIAAIYGIEETAGAVALVLELVEGESLADRLLRGPIAVDEALPIARQLADALDAAHQRGIVHRDLKPANIRIRPDGTVKVLDFGLAKHREPDQAAASAATTAAAAARTRSGMVLGTPAYMSPEQAPAMTVDSRADVWAFGCVLFEMLSGRATFAGETFADIIAAVLTDDPKWDLLPDIPASVSRLLRRCLEKDVGRRLSDIADARADLEPRKRTRRAIAKRPVDARPPVPPRPREDWTAERAAVYRRRGCRGGRHV